MAFLPLFSNAFIGNVKAHGGAESWNYSLGNA